ncbi:hypothetical protein [Cryptosporangium phraense]|uniref:Uncharacterized protein n=1 Tax=Cryptosporangium phraense TaxID=2593070 RepID=A0A545ANJ3_9ACTN|nr:hypothetical protein [Cryptosporangium phraense]TQS42856.1 hypothetical protein FL583_22670 [Cryptosporangium phraense]
MTKLSQHERAADQAWKAGIQGPGNAAFLSAILAALSLVGGVFASAFLGDGTPFIVGLAGCMQLYLVRVVFRWMEARFKQTEQLIQHLLVDD